MARPPKPKTVSYALIERDTEIGAPMYTLLDELVEKHHEELSEARIALAWNTAWKPDVDGHCVLGKCRKTTDLDRELAAYDFVIILRREFWYHDKVTTTQRTALLDHELTHATVRLDKHGEPVIDERGRQVYRLRTHDIEEFGCIIQRYGLWKHDLRWFVAQAPEVSVREPAPRLVTDDGEQLHEAAGSDERTEWWQH